MSILRTRFRLLNLRIFNTKSFQQGFIAAICSIGLATASPLFAQEPLNLSKALEMAVEADTQWRSIKASLAAQRELLPQAKARLLPSVNTSASYFKTDTEVDSQGSGGSNNSNVDYDGSSKSLRLEVRQPILNWQAFKLFKSAKKTMKIVDYNLALAEQSLLLRLSNAYFALLLAEESLVLAQSELRAIEQQLDQTEQRFKVGLVSRTDVLEAEAAADQTQVAVAIAENDQAIAKENLSIIVGSPVSGVQNLKQDIPLSPQEEALPDWLEIVLTENLNFRVAKLNQVTAALSRDATNASYWPTIDAVAIYSDSEDSFERTSTQYGLQASWQPFQGGGLRSRVRQAELIYESALTDVAGLQQTLSRDARNLYKTLATDIVRIKAQQQAIVSSESALEATKAGYEVGIRNLVDVLNAQRSVFRAKRDFAEARYTWIIHRLDAAALDATLGPDSLLAIDTWLQP